MMDLHEQLELYTGNTQMIGKLILILRNIPIKSSEKKRLDAIANYILETTILLEQFYEKYQ